MMTGTIKTLTDKGFGFICDNETGQDIFVHTSGLIDTIREGDNVSFEVEEGKRGLNAVKVSIAS